jgi:hypothetical protein
MTTVNYLYNIGVEVFHVDPIKGVRDAVVRALTISVTQAGQTISYEIVFKKPENGSAIVPEPTLYADVDSALIAYRPSILV